MYWYDAYRYGDTADEPIYLLYECTVPTRTRTTVLGMRRLQCRMSTRTHTRTSTDLQYKQYEYAHNIDDDESRRHRAASQVATLEAVY